ncbi:acyltransferase domain-containing protein, partial [Saccharothrix sp. MB29]|nr:acyltransferase domain-containing protein [Saccharothrix sp. MB29]
LSTVRGEVLDGSEFDADYWVANLRLPVLFHGAVDTLLDQGYRFVVEVSPHPVLTPAVQQAIDAHERDAVALGTLRRNEPESARLLTSLGELHVHGGPVDWRAVLPDAATVTLPPTASSAGALAGVRARRAPDAVDAEFWDAVDRADLSALADGLAVDADVVAECSSASPPGAVAPGRAPPPIPGATASPGTPSTSRAHPAAGGCWSSPRARPSTT